MVKKSKTRSIKSTGKTMEIGRNTAIVLVIGILTLAWYVHTNPITTTVVLVLGVIVALIAAIGYVLGKGTLGGILSKLIKR